MSIQDVIQLGSTIAAILVLINEFLNLIREWRLGSPELRLVRSQIEFQNRDLLDVLKSMADRVQQLHAKIVK